MTNWQEVKLGDVCDFQNGYAFKSREFVTDGNINIVKIKELKNGQVVFTTDTAKVVNSEIYKQYQVSKGDILVALTGDPVSKSNPLSWVGRVSLYNYASKSLLNQRVAKFKPDGTRLDTIFIYYFFREFENFFNLAQKATGSASQANISTKTLNETIINLPPLDVQKKIAGVLGALDDKIELNNKINNNLEQQAQALFKSWFVDREYEVEKDTNLGVVCKCELGGTPSRVKPEYWNGNIAWINSGEVNNFRIIKASEYITEIGLKHSATKLLPRKTTVIAITGATLGQISLLEIDSCTNQSVVGILENETLPYEFIYPYICHNIKELLSHQTGGAQQHINKQNVEQIALSLPKATLIKDYKNIVSPIFELIAKNCFESERLSALRDTLLPKLMSGEIDVDKVSLRGME